MQDCSTKWSLKNTIGRLDLPKMKDDNHARKRYGSLNCGPLGDAFGAMARALALFFRLELADSIVYKITTAFVDFNFTFYLSISARANIDK